MPENAESVCLRTINVEVVWTQAGDDEVVRKAVSAACSALERDLLYEGVANPAVLSRGTHAAASDAPC